MQFEGATSRDLARQLINMGCPWLYCIMMLNFCIVYLLFVHSPEACVRGGVLGPAYSDGTDLACLKQTYSLNNRLLRPEMSRRQAPCTEEVRHVGPGWAPGGDVSVPVARGTLRGDTPGGTLSPAARPCRRNRPTGSRWLRCAPHTPAGRRGRDGLAGRRRRRVLWVLEGTKVPRATDTTQTDSGFGRGS